MRGEEFTPQRGVIGTGGGYSDGSSITTAATDKIRAMKAATKRVKINDELPNALNPSGGGGGGGGGVGVQKRQFEHKVLTEGTHHSQPIENNEALNPNLGTFGVGAGIALRV